MSRGIFRAAAIGLFLLGIRVGVADISYADAKGVMGKSEPIKDDRPWVKAKALEKGDTIMFVAPASNLNRERMALVKERLEAMGFKTKAASDLFRKYGYLGGTDERRAEEIMDAFTDPEVDAIFPGTGGYGTTRMLHLLDYDVIREHPKMLVGFSDITGLHLAIQKKAKLITIHTPSPMYGLGSKGNLSDFSAKYFFRAILNEKYFDEDGNKKEAGYVIETPAERPKKMPEVEVVRKGKAQGRLTGGNLSLIAATMGTPYEIDTKGKILFIEDVGEKVYRIDRYLSTLFLAGKFDDAAGIVLCHFTSLETDEDSIAFKEVIDRYFGKLNKPVIKGFSVGHHKYNASIPMGAIAELNTETKQLKLIEDPVLTVSEKNGEE